MKLNKKILSVFVFFALILGCSFSAFAAPVDDLKASLIKIGVPAEQVGQVSEYLQSIVVTDTTYNTINQKIDETVTALNGQKDLTALDDAAVATVEKNIADSFKLLGLTANFTTADDGAIDLAVTKTDGQELFKMNSANVNTMLTNFNAQDIKAVMTNSKEVTKTSGDTLETGSTGDQLNHTAANYGNFIVFGSILVIASGIWMAANRRVSRC